MSYRFRISLRSVLLLVALFVVLCAWFQARQDRLRAEHESRVVNLKTRLVYVEEFLTQYRTQLRDPQGDHLQAIDKISTYEQERQQLLERIEWR